METDHLLNNRQNELYSQIFDKEDANEDDNTVHYEEQDISNVLQNQLGEQFRLSTNSIRQMQNEEINPKALGGISIRKSQRNVDRGSDAPPGVSINVQDSPDKQKLKVQNLFGKARTGSKSRDSVRSGENLEGQVRKQKTEREFENRCLRLLKIEDWQSLDELASKYLEETHGTTFKGLFYLGVSLYKQGDYENAIRAFQKAEEINSDDAQLQYNLGLAYFKLEQYNQCVDHLKKCTKLDESHIYAYNNLAFLFNMHQFYSETIQVCGQAKMNNPTNHNCHRHWAFALFKKGEFAKAIKKIKKGVQKNPIDPENWIIWGLILRTVGNYVSAKHKFKKALKLDKENETAKEELSIVDRIIELDKQIPLEAVPSLKRNNPKKGIIKDGLGGESGCARQCHYKNCSIF
ncbi:tpr repeat [Stylonychia lemnae]|uniref:Tpr repeat n=1 Tax=Stylonychia lemnae TaxID=5949 RepID=A0A078A806_STYLE|nr:tpr repeat [Stylonychia lemnae]|eukprot:CDW78380.1 tpr repeat [Stylonychia lemnae]